MATRGKANSFHCKLFSRKSQIFPLCDAQLTLERRRTQADTMMPFLDLENVGKGPRFGRLQFCTCWLRCQPCALLPWGSNDPVNVLCNGEKEENLAADSEMCLLASALSSAATAMEMYIVTCSHRKRPERMDYK
ncbi:uncharacterized protein LOC111529568 isoform X4 [Piliocolobus tephrosceles]|uniref:uncharacterized protein LOC111529568 isoform X4 n=1 Tax=Piliocolobus tephrosceles TaxID=591936 RepID=UPI000C2A73B9|nr:uncharacterized protein LOC111529568 isoform X4 [Piliocolobus tephrosceles]